MNLQELGDLFRQERERQGLTIDVVVEKTRISKINVQAIESGQSDLLPHPVYAKGFVKNYARLLGLDPDKLAAVMAMEYTIEEEIPVEESPREQMVLSRGRGGFDSLRRRRMNLVILVLAVLAIVGGLVAYSFLSASPDKAAAPVEMIGGQGGESTPEEAAAPAEEHAAMAPADEDGAPVVDAAAEAVAPVAQDEPAAATEAPAEAQPAVAQTPAAEAPREEAPVAAAVHAPQRVDVHATTGVCWLLAKVDGGDEHGGVTVDVTLQPGQSKLIRFDKTMTLKLGNAGAVSLRLNDKPYALDAKQGQVRTLSFSAE
ncbi:cytoskeleton protein RodZ [Desulfobaculum xiamenense]|uniref:Cytoskeleton protein RodZ n=1 Tax=Desulfobaculum xiamenense TaxID=995050 RepID=A0A846QJV4_9BACT|nr:helix-turn-helix domain-containing protein [Desulfobaculum xiamenense]NJB66762.1 cytoskeleton protein RodZ [Desulfobaculum xiamenense]